MSLIHMRATRRTLTVLLTASLLTSCSGDSAGRGDAAGGDAAGSDCGDITFEGEELTIVVPVPPGGATDGIARLAAPLLGEHLPGSPAVQVQNIPGGGTVTGANEYTLTFEPDGTNILMVAPPTVAPWVLGDPVVKYDLAAMTPVAGFPTSRLIYAGPDAGLEDAGDLFGASELFMGGVSAAGGELTQILALEVLGLRDQIDELFGYQGYAEVVLALQQGEIDLAGESTISYLGATGASDLAEEGVFTPLFTLGMPNGEGGLEPDPAAPDLPTVLDLYEEEFGEEPTGEAWDAFMAVHSVMSQMPFGLLVHGEAPECRAEALREAMDQVVGDPEFRDKAVTLVGPYDPLTGDELAGVVSGLKDLDEDTVAWVVEFLETNYDLEL